MLNSVCQTALGTNVAGQLPCWKNDPAALKFLAYREEPIEGSKILSQSHRSQQITLSMFSVARLYSPFTMVTLHEFSFFYYEKQAKVMAWHNKI